MRLAMMVAMQAAQAVPIAGPIAGPPLPIELRPVRPAPVATPCGQPDDKGDIVICGRSSDGNRIGRLDPGRYGGKRVRAETRVIGQLRVAAEAEQGSLPNGQSSPRAMVRLKLSF